MDYEELLQNQILERKTTALSLDPELYSKKTLFRCCYKFTDRLYIYLSHDKDNTNVLVYLTTKGDFLDLNSLVGEFTNELLDQELRELVLQDTKKIRDTIVTRALISGQSNAI